MKSSLTPFLPARHCGTVHRCYRELRESLCAFPHRGTLRALVEKGLVKLGNFRKNQNKRQYAYLLTPAGLEEKTRIAQAFLKCKEAKFGVIRREVEALKSELESSGAGENNGCPIFTCCPLL